MHLPARFWDKALIKGANDCWEWQACVSADGYGRFTFNGVVHFSHRLALASTGIEVNGFVVRHSCDNRKCINPAHLSAGTDADNVRDRDTRGRGRWRGKPGAENPMAKLSEETVRELRSGYARLRRHKSGRLMNGELDTLARAFGLPRGTVRNIVEGYQWKHIA